MDWMMDMDIIDSRSPTSSRMMHMSTVEPQSDKCESTSWFNWRWRPTSTFCLAFAEAALLRRLGGCKTDVRFTKLPCGAEIRTLYATSTRSDPDYLAKVPLVLVHGMGSGIALWFKNIPALAKKQPVYAIDVIGFGRSSRIKFPSDAEQTEACFVSSIEDWRKAEGLNKMALLGHSFGGYLAMAYSLKYHEHLSHLILVDPWGMDEKPSDHQGPSGVFGFLVRTFSRYNPMAIVRVAGPFGPSLVHRFRNDLGQYFSEKDMDNMDVSSDETVNGSNNDEQSSSARDALNYIYHCNAQYPSGETGFHNLSLPIAWARYPMVPRALGLSPTLPVTFVYGSDSWMIRYPRRLEVEDIAGYKIKAMRGEESYTNVKLIPHCGHHVYAQDPLSFNTFLKREIKRVENILNTK